MTILINGKKKIIPDACTVSDLLDYLGVEPGAVAVERNAMVVRKEHFDLLALEEGDKLEIVRFVGGG